MLALCILAEGIRTPVGCGFKAETAGPENREPWSATGQEILSITFQAWMETDLGLQEFARLTNDENIYKLVGPVLLKQDKIEADSTVKGRLEFITKEM